MTHCITYQSVHYLNELYFCIIIYVSDHVIFTTEVSLSEKFYSSLFDRLEFTSRPLTRDFEFPARRLGTIFRSPLIGVQVTHMTTLY